MSVFLRWGIFGILGVAALLYAYNASKRIAATQAAKPQVAAVEPAQAPADEEAEEPAVAAPPPAEPAPEVPAQCEAELVVAQRAIQLKKAGEPLDRVLRMQEIAWEETPARRERLEKVASRWYGYEGSFQPGALRMAVVNDCRQSAPAP
jgi:type IV secretory pathway VirB10-like protein